MATDNQRMLTTIQAGEDLTTLQYHAVALDDGKLANTAEEASGILLNKPKSGEFITLGYIGEMKFAAGAAITLGTKLTVTTSGWFTSAGSTDVVIGEAKSTVTSGSIGTGIFNFPTGNGTAPDKINYASFTPIANIISGVGVGLASGTVAATGIAAHAISQSAVSSGIAGTDFLLFGKGIGRMSPAFCSSLGDLLTTTTSGYFAICGSGYVANALALANIGSGSTGNILFYGPGSIKIA